MLARIQDFQSIKDATLTIEGLTVVVGPSDVGKSALIRAVSAALFNRAGDSFVRNGSDVAVVRLRQVPGAGGAMIDDMTWTKGKTPCVYLVDGQRYAKVGKDTPAVVQDAGFHDVLDGLRPQIAGQFDLPFLLKAPPPELAAALAGASKLDIFDTAVSACAADLLAASASLKTIAKQLTTDSAALDTIKAAADGWTGRDVLGRVEALQVRVGTVQAVSRAWARLRAARAVPAPAALPAAPSDTLSRVLAALTRRRDARLVPAPAPLPAVPVSPLQRAADAAIRLVVASQVPAPLAVPALVATSLPEIIAAARRRAVARLVPAPVAAPLLPATKLPEIIAAAKRRALARRVPAPPAVPDIAVIATMLSPTSVLTSVSNKLSTLLDLRSREILEEMQCRQAMLNLTLDRALLDAFRTENPLCPTCTQPWASASNG